MSTFAVQLTGPGTAAIAVILLSGDHAADILRQITPAPRLAACHGSGHNLDGQTPAAPRHVTLLHPTSREKIDDAILLQTAPSSFELHIHGGIAVAAAILQALHSAGAQLLTPEQARTRGLFGPALAGELALALPLAKTLTAARLLAAQLDAGLAAWVRHWQSWLTNNCKSPSDLWPLHSAAQWLLARSHTLAHLLDPPRIAIIGPPNAGKSTLANALLGRPVSITSDIAGTTRDWVDALATFLSAEVQIPVILIDTAGIRQPADPIEQESIARTHHQAHAAHAIILLFDASRPPTPDHRALFHRYAGRGVPLILAANKSDLLSQSQIQNLKFQISNFKSEMLNLTSPLPLSAKNHTGLETLMTAVLHQLDLAKISPTEPFAFTPRQRDLLENLALTNDAPAARDLLAQIHNA